MFAKPRLFFEAPLFVDMPSTPCWRPSITGAMLVAESVHADRKKKAQQKEKRKPDVSWKSFQKRFSGFLSRGGDEQKMAACLGYSRSDLMNHLERQFAKGMSWSNYAGNVGYKEFSANPSKYWVVDHVVPKKLFPKADVRGCYALSNLRPFFGDKNMKKGGNRLHLL